MKKEEHTAIIQDIRKALDTEKIDVAHITEQLTYLSDDYGTVLAENSETKLKNESLTSANENLRDTNMRLFLKVGSPAENPNNQNGGNPSDNSDKLTFENLFNEKGELK